jgi:hypothetical protein
VGEAEESALPLVFQLPWCSSDSTTGLLFGGDSSAFPKIGAVRPRFISPPAALAQCFGFLLARDIFIAGEMARACRASLRSVAMATWKGLRDG